MSENIRFADRPVEHTGTGSDTWPAFKPGEKNTRPKDSRGKFLRDQREVRPEDLKAVDDLMELLLRDLKVDDVSELNTLQAVGVEILMMRWRFLKGLRNIIDEKGLLVKNTDTDLSDFVKSYLQHSKEFFALLLKLFPEFSLNTGSGDSDDPLTGMNGGDE